ncbi:G2/mitotic-specific cyclin-B2-like [Leptinotarsa decemlineata]|uniref:G2/mitotic-specific cyclin-B2-like n=1 Tax=Leptinotarsa decemlineata TaxID=7539 RepID=UPI003D30C772
MNAIHDPDVNFRNESEVKEYVKGIYSFLRKKETELPIRKNFLDGHRTNPTMRAMLINWLVAVHTCAKMIIETLHICVAIVDRYLQDHRRVGRKNFQLVGISAILIACKYEERHLPDIRDLEQACSYKYSGRQILEMESNILKALNFNLGRPLSLNFLRKYNNISRASIIHHTLGKYILELALMEYEISHVKPSLQAAAACCLSRGILDGVIDLSTLWTPSLVCFTKYVYCDFKEVVERLADILAHSETSQFQNIREKYALEENRRISSNPKLKAALNVKFAKKLKG